ncbi:MAG TPA: hypothetical protein VL068_01660 [Microthrixaceae bacterium]|nr:hypothetical protein [Microthrixaceae bacterium]
MVGGAVVGGAVVGGAMVGGAMVGGAVVGERSSRFWQGSPLRNGLATHSRAKI